MACNPTRLELSNTDVTSIEVTVSPDPGDSTSVVLEIPGLAIDQSQPTSSAVATFAIGTLSASTNSLWDGTLQVGTNAPADIVVQVVATSQVQTIGATISGADVSYCAPTSGAGGGSAVDSYLMLIESPTAGKTYTLDGRAATARTIDSLYAKTSANTCSIALKNLTDTATIASMTVSSTGSLAGSVSSASIDENDRLAIEITLASSPEDLEIVVEYTV